MDVAELRVGNYVDEGIIHWICYFHGILSCGILKNKFSSFSEAIELSQLNPIPLTEDWLLKFGFERDLALEKLDSRREFKEFKYGNQEDHQFIRVCFHPVGRFTLSVHNAPLTKPEFVHKLQNTVYELIDKELQIKE